MKISEIKVGEEYAVSDDPKRSRDLPRQVKVLEIITETEEYWGGGQWAAERKTRNVRRVKVEVLDDNHVPVNRWSYGGQKVKTAKQGDTIVLEARLFIASWASLRKDVLARIAARELKATTKMAYEERIAALLGVKSLEQAMSYVTVDVRRGILLVEARLSDEELNTILDLAEKGKS